MGRPSHVTTIRAQRQLATAFVLVGPPTAWGAMLLAGYAAQEISCDVDVLGGQTGEMTARAVVVALGLIAGAGCLLGIAVSRGLRRDGDDAGRRVAEEDRHIAAVGVVIGAVFLLTVLFTIAAAFVLEPCA